MDTDQAQELTRLLVPEHKDAGHQTQLHKAQDDEASPKGKVPESRRLAKPENSLQAMDEVLAVALRQVLEEVRLH